MTPTPAAARYETYNIQEHEIKMTHTKESLMTLIDAFAANPNRKVRTQVEDALTEVFAERDESLEACKLFLAYDSNESDDGVEMMLNYALDTRRPSYLPYSKQICKE